MTKQRFIDYVQGEMDTRGWTRAELARRAHVDPSTITRLLNGERAPTVDVVGAIATALKEPPLTLIKMAGLLPDGVPPYPPLQDASIREISDLLRDMTPDERVQVIDYAKWLRRRNRNQT